MVLRCGVILATILMSSFLSIGSVQASDTVTPSEIITILRNTHVLKPEVSLHATYDEHNKLAVVLTDRSPKAVEKDCKIDAVLVAKKLVDSFPNDINTVRVIFNVPGKDDARQVDVTKIDVKAYGSGAVKADELLATLNVVRNKESEESGPSAGAGSLGVAPGPLEGQRMIQLGRIEKLRKNGTGVSKFQELFDKIEDEAKAGNQAALYKDVPDLRMKLDEQFELLRQAQDAENGRGLQTTGMGAGRRGNGQGEVRQTGRQRGGGGPSSQSGPGPGSELIRQGVLENCQRWASAVSASAAPNKSTLLQSINAIQSLAQSNDPDKIRQAVSMTHQLHSELIQEGILRPRRMR